jgi:hypothetical protein
MGFVAGVMVTFVGRVLVMVGEIVVMAFNVSVMSVLLEVSLLIVIVRFGTRSLEYHVRLFNPSLDALQMFLDELNFPLSAIYVRQHRYNPLTNQGTEPPINYLWRSSQNPSLLQVKKFERLTSAIPTIALAVVVAIMGILATRVTIFDAVMYFFWSAVFFAQFVYFWRFGHQIKDIKERLQNEKNNG